MITATQVEDNKIVTFKYDLKFLIYIFIGIVVVIGIIILFIIRTISDDGEPRSGNTIKALVSFLILIAIGSAIYYMLKKSDFTPEKVNKYFKRPKARQIVREKYKEPVYIAKSLCNDEYFIE